MDKKELIRKKYLILRKKKYFEIKKDFFYPLKKIISNKNKNISIYYPNSFEVNVLKILEIDYFKRFNFLLPIINNKNSMSFYKWKKNEVLFVNRYGIPEPLKSKKISPNVILLPLLAFDKHKNRIGYGKGYYDKFLNRYLKLHKKILTFGVAFSFQKYQNLPSKTYDFKLDHIITEKGII